MISDAYNLYSLYDTVAGLFMAPSVYRTDDLAFRDLRFIVNNDPKFKASAGDYELILVGAFDPVLGVVSDCDHVLKCRLSDLVENESE